MGFNNLHDPNNMTVPLVSICISTYQHVNYIRQCLDSILNQKTNFDFEVVLGEDESTDGTREICIEYANKYPDKIRLFLRSRSDVIYVDGSATGRFNFTENLKASKGKYIALCEGDDYWLAENKLQLQVNLLEANPDYSMVYHPIYIIKDKNEKILSDLNPDKNEFISIEELAKGNIIQTSSVIFRSQYLNKLPVWYNQSPVGDYILYMILANNGKIKWIPEVMSTYRLHDGGIWSKIKNTTKIKRWIMVVDFLLKEQFNPVVISNLEDQKRRTINTLLEFNASEDWPEFIKDLEFYVLKDEKLIKYWVVKRFPAMIVTLKNLRSYTISQRIKKGLRLLRLYKD